MQDLSLHHTNNRISHEATITEACIFYKSKKMSLSCEVMQEKPPSVSEGGFLTIREYRLLIVLRFDLEVCLRMVANGANFGCLFANTDMTTVAALPDAVAVA